MIEKALSFYSKRALLNKMRLKHATRGTKKCLQMKIAQFWPLQLYGLGLVWPYVTYCCLIWPFYTILWSFILKYRFDWTCIVFSRGH